METMVLGPWNCLIQENSENHKNTLSSTLRHILYPGSAWYGHPVTVLWRDIVNSPVLLLFYQPSYFYFSSTSFLTHFCTFLYLSFFYSSQPILLGFHFANWISVGMIEKKDAPYSCFSLKKLLKFDLFQENFWDLTGKQMVGSQLRY